MDLLHHSRRLLQAAASPNGNTGTTGTLSGHFNTSMAIVLVVLLSAFFFMGFFSIYVKRCATREEDEARSRTGTPTNPANVLPQGVDPAFLDTLPLIVYSASKKKGSLVECSVCLIDFAEGGTLCQLPRCKHVFHKQCIDTWLLTNTNCPLCRRSVLADGSLSFRWGSSGSLRLSLRRMRSRRDSSGWFPTAGPLTTEGGDADASFEGFLRQTADATPTAELEGSGARNSSSFPRSHSTGHSLVKQGQSRMLMTEGSSDNQGTEPKPVGLPPTSPAVYGRSRSMVAARDDVPTGVSFGTWMSGARASMRQVLNFKKVNPAAGESGMSAGLAGVATSSSGRSTFNRLNPV